MRYTVTHITTYRYQDLVAVSHNLLHLGPRDLPYQQVLGHRLTVSPEPTVFHRSQDYFGNRAATVTVQTPHRELVVTSTSTIERSQQPIPDPALTPPWEAIADTVRRADLVELLPVVEYA